MLDVDSASLKGQMPHFCVSGEEPESRVAGETAVFILHQVLEVVSDGNWNLTLASVGKRVGKAQGK